MLAPGGGPAPQLSVGCGDLAARAQLSRHVRQNLTFPRHRGLFPLPPLSHQAPQGRVGGGSSGSAP
jgi:hypothetical protein